MTQLLTRRRLLALVPASLVGVFFGRAAAQSAQAKEPITVYKDPTCGCCHKWV
jgi:hypothetical protein